MAAIISSSECGRRAAGPTFVIRTIGSRLKPSARTAPPDGRARPAAAESRPLSTPTQMPVPDDVDRVGRRALVVVAEAAERAGQRRVGGDVHQLRAEPERAELRQVEPGGAGEGRLPAEDPVELDGVADRLVDLERHLLAAEDQVRRVERRARVGAVSSARASSAIRARVAGQVELADELPAARPVLAADARVATGAASRPRRRPWRSSPRRTRRCAGRRACPRCETSHLRVSQISWLASAEVGAVRRASSAVTPSSRSPFSARRHRPRVLAGTRRSQWPVAGVPGRRARGPCPAHQRRRAGDRGGPLAGPPGGRGADVGDGEEPPAASRSARGRRRRPAPRGRAPSTTPLRAPIASRADLHDPRVGVAGAGGQGGLDGGGRDVFHGADASPGRVLRAGVRRRRPTIRA